MTQLALRLDQREVEPDNGKPHRTRGVHFSTQLLKWIGNKQRSAPWIISHFPDRIERYVEPFLGAGGVLGVLAPQRAIGSDVFAPLVDIWCDLQKQPAKLSRDYEVRWLLINKLGKQAAYKEVLASYNRKPNGPDLLFLCRACYGGVVRFRKADGYMSTPCGAHMPISPSSFDERVRSWRERVAGATFCRRDFREALFDAKQGDLIYCDPPYKDSQAILYGAQSFSLRDFYLSVEVAIKRGAKIVVSIDGQKKSGARIVDIEAPRGLFKREVLVPQGKSMLRRFQMNGSSLENEEVSDRLLLTY